MEEDLLHPRMATIPSLASTPTTMASVPKRRHTCSTKDESSTALVPSAASVYAELLTALTYSLMARSGSLITNLVDHREAGERFNFQST